MKLGQGKVSEAYLERIAQTRIRFINGIDDRVQSVRKVMSGEAQEPAAETPQRTIHRMLHDMAGNTAMLQLPEIEKVVRTALAIAETCDDEDRQMTPEERNRFSADLDEIARLAAESSTVEGN